MSVWASLRSWLDPGDEERLVKKNDDLSSRSQGHNRTSSRDWNLGNGRVSPRRRTLKRVAVLIGTAVFIYIFIHNIPTDLGPPSIPRPHFNSPQDRTSGGSGTSPPPAGSERDAPASVTSKDLTLMQRTYSGPPKFYELGATLSAIHDTKGRDLDNRNVLFAASSLKSAATLLPIACKMGVELRNYVHFVLMSRSEISLDELQEINGVDKNCKIIFHDARPDQVAISTDERLEFCVFRGFHYIHAYMHPQAIFIDGSDDEEPFFRKSARAQVKVVKNTLIELPSRTLEGLVWLTKLDSSSLRVWNKLSIDILIHGPRGSSGGFTRLLQSLGKADYSSGPIPHITIELPHDVDQTAQEYLSEFEWPPSHVPNPTKASFLSIRRRIPRPRLSEEESSARLLESFWPTDAHHSHVLVLSPHVELSPNFYHYLKYMILEYRYSNGQRSQNLDQRLFGISLEQPFTLITGDKKLTIPERIVESEEETSTAFRWEAPGSNAMLYMGDKWMELHDLVSRTLEVQRNNPPPLISSKLVSTKYPSWLEYALQLSRARGYWTLYPGKLAASNLVTVHTEMETPPEEYVHLDEGPEPLRDEASAAEIKAAMMRIKAGPEVVLTPGPLLQCLSHEGDLPAARFLPLLTWDGKEVALEDFDSEAAAYKDEFRRKSGKCDAETEDNDDNINGKGKARLPFTTTDLFCQNKNEQAV